MSIRPLWTIRGMLAALTVATLAAAGALAATGAAAAESNGGVRVIPLGDSITDGTQVPGGYRIGLWQRLLNNQFRVDFVGSQFNGPANLGDHDHEGHPGWRIDQIDANIVAWLRTTTPHTVLLHIGTNDVLQNFNLAGAPGRLSTLIDHITATAPTAEVFVATIIPIANAGQEANGRTFNATIPGIVQSKVNAGRHVHLVDMHAALTTADLIDGVHPTATGYDKMANTWFTALRSVPGSVGDPGGGTPPPASSCHVVDEVNTWNTGLTSNLTVTNTGSTPVNGWNLVFTLAGGQTITSGWNATYAPASGQVTANNMSYNATVNPNTSVGIGFQANHTGNAAKPTSFTLNGTACTIS
ncbi:MAG: cellulose binding domain-containing protein [Labedaea sp.]